MTAPAPGTLGDVDMAFRAALEHDAAVSPPEIPAPPRLAASDDPAAPHGRNADGSPIAPYGLKADGTPRLKPAGPGRGHRGDTTPRIQKTGGRHAAPAARPDPAPGTATDYHDDLAGFASGVWMLAANCKGEKLGPLRIPDLRAYAHAWHITAPGMVNAWNVAAQKNETVRGYVEKLSGEGSWAWVIGVALASAPFVGAVAELRKNPELRAEFAELTDTELDEFTKALGIEKLEIEAAARAFEAADQAEAA